MATSPDGCVLSPVAGAVSLYTPVAGEHGCESAVALVLAGGFLVNSWLATV